LFNSEVVTSPESLGRVERDAVKAARAHLTQNANKWGIDPKQFSPTMAIDGVAGMSVVRFGQTIGNLEVANSLLAITVDKNGFLLSHTKSISDFSGEKLASINEAEVTELLKLNLSEDLGIANDQVVVAEVKLVIVDSALVDDVPSLIGADVLNGGAHPLRLGLTTELPWIKRQQRVTYQRVGVVDPRSAQDYEANGGVKGLKRALGMTQSDVVTEVTDSGLRGRGGAAFPTGIKWRTVLEAPGTTKYIVCNADEGDSGTFADRMLMEGDPFMLLEGMTIAGWAVGANTGYIYVRSEYPEAIEALNKAVDAATEQGWLGDNVLGSGFAFTIQVRVGAGAYICGEETALLESLEGKRGVVRAKPPLPALEGLFGKPTVVNNVLSLGTIPAILADGAAAYAALGMGRSRGTQVFQLAGNIARGGIMETAFGITLGELVNDLGGATESGRPIRAVQVGGPLGAYLPTDKFDLPMDYESFAAADAMVGHGGIVVFDDTVNMAAQARFAMEFCAVESCGKCTPCRIGSTRGVELIDKITAGINRDANIEVLVDLCEVMADGSLCAMGGLTPLPVRSALKNFTEDFQG
jgi:formate dehydrogenase iron-sulfur subunit